jgi:hypothetical protein
MYLSGMLEWPQLTSCPKTRCHLKRQKDEGLFDAIECPRKSNLLSACLLICQFFWCFDRQIWISQNFCCCAFLCPRFTMKSVCLSVNFFVAGFLLCLSKMHGGMHPPLHSTPSSLRASSIATPAADFDCLYIGNQWADCYHGYRMG